MKLLLCRTIILYLCVLFAMRLMGKRQLGELQPEELVSTILISNLASISIESEDVPITASLIPLFLIAALELLGSVVSFRSQKFFNFLSGRPKTVILDGKIDQNALRMLRLTCWVAVRPSVSVTKCRMGSGLEVMTVHTLRRFRLSMAVSTMVLRPMSPSTQYIPVCGP